MTSQKGSARKRAAKAGGEAVDVGFGALFKGLGDFVGVLGNMVETGENQINRTGEFKVKGLGDKAHGVYGMSVRVGIGGEPHIERFGNIRTTAEGPEVVVSGDAIDIEVRGDVLALSSSGERRYAKETLLPSPVDPGSLRRSFKNGLLELRLKKS